MEATPEWRAAVRLWQYCPPFLFVFGTFGNVMTVVILRRMRMRESAMPVYLTALAVSDTCLLYTGLLRRWVMNVFDLDFRTTHTAACKLHTWSVYSLTIVSAWILLFMAVERILSVWRPHHVSILCTRGKVVVIVLAIVTSSSLANAHFLYGVDVVTVPEPGGGRNGTGSVRVCASPDAEYMYFFDAVWSWVDLTLSSLIPFIVLIVGNSLILWKVSLSVRQARYLGSGPDSSVTRQRKKTTSSMTVTLLALSLIFFLLTSPICVHNLIEHYVEAGLEGDPRGQGRLALAWAVVNILMYVNSTVNFYLYCLSGSRFRRELRRCMTTCLCRLPLASSPWKTSQNLHSSHNPLNPEGYHYNDQRHHLGDVEGYHYKHHRHHLGDVEGCHYNDHRHHLGDVEGCHSNHHRHHLGDVEGCHSNHHRHHLGNVQGYHSNHHRHHLGDVEGCHSNHHDQNGHCAGAGLDHRHHLGDDAPPPHDAVDGGGGDGGGGGGGGGGCGGRLHSVSFKVHARSMQTVLTDRHDGHNSTEF